MIWFLNHRFFDLGLIRISNSKQSRASRPIFTMCAWHDAGSDLLAERLEVKRLPLPDGRATPTRQGQFPEMGHPKEA